MALGSPGGLFEAFIILLLDLAFGDPQYKWHPIRLMGKGISHLERLLFKWHLNNRFGGVLLLLAGGLVLGAYLGLHHVLAQGHVLLAWAFSIYLGWSFFSLRDLIDHGRAVTQALDESLGEARKQVAKLVGRDTEPMNDSDCRRAVIESVSENVVDGVLSPLLFYAIGGIPAMLLFKWVSTLDSMVGYKNERYLAFGWAGARLDDVFNYFPSRLGFLLIVIYSYTHKHLSGRDALTVGLAQHALVPGPNSGWSEAATSGALGVKLAGPINLRGKVVNQTWLGKKQFREKISNRDVGHSFHIALGVTFLFFALWAGAWVLWEVIL